MNTQAEVQQHGYQRRQGAPVTAIGMLSRLKPCTVLAVCAIAAAPLSAQETRQLDVHEHGVGQLDLAFDGGQIAMALQVPGADIMGFEYAPQSAQDRAAVEAALEVLAKPFELFVIAQDAGCRVTQASAELESEGAHADHGAHDDHADEHKHDDHDHKDHDDHDHEEHAEEAGHTEFHAEYLLTCADPTAATSIRFAYFDVFPNALEVDVQVISDTGATAFEVERDAPILDLRSIF